MELDAIVVEGYDGVGKGHVLNLLSESYGVTPYRPDYNFWQNHDVLRPDRWKMSGFFWDIFSHFNIHPDNPMLFDRGVISGAVYNNDISIAKDYHKLIEGMKVMHILVCCEKESFIKMRELRELSDDSSSIDELWNKYKEYTARYLEALSAAGVDYIIYSNKIDEDTLEASKFTCLGCGHFNYGWCRHPSIKTKVSSENRRCEYSKDREVQDAPEMQCL